MKRATVKKIPLRLVRFNGRLPPRHVQCLFDGCGARFSSNPPHYHGTQWEEYRDLKDHWRSINALEQKGDDAVRCNLLSMHLSRTIFFSYMYILFYKYSSVDIRFLIVFVIDNLVKETSWDPLSSNLLLLFTKYVFSFLLLLSTTRLVRRCYYYYLDTQQSWCEFLTLETQQSWPWRRPGLAPEKCCDVWHSQPLSPAPSSVSDIWSEQSHGILWRGKLWYGGKKIV